MSDWKTATKLVHAGARRSQYGEMSEAIFLTQGFVYDSAEQAEARFQKAGDDEFIYARYGNPTVRMFEERIAAIEGTEDAFATASGMAAVNGALTALLKAGDHVVSARALFGSCLYVLEILARFGVEVTLVDGTDLDAWRKAVRPDTKALFLETVSNPTLEVIDLRAVAEIGHAVSATVIVDNVFATPTFSQAVALGADVVVYSATKHIDGSGRCLGGVVCARGPLGPFRSSKTGGCSWDIGASNFGSAVQKTPAALLGGVVNVNKRVRQPQLRGHMGGKGRCAKTLGGVVAGGKIGHTHLAGVMGLGLGDFASNEGLSPRGNRPFKIPLRAARAPCYRFNSFLRRYYAGYRPF